MQITVEQIISCLGIIAGVITSIGIIFAAVQKTAHKVVDKEKQAIIGEIKTQLGEISASQKELKEQSDELRKEIILIMRLNQVMTKELQTLGHTNGETAQALNELNDYLLNK